MTNRAKSGRKETVSEVRKPFLNGDVTDENTVKSSLLFFGTMLIVIIVAFIACISASSGSVILKVLINTAVIALALMIFFNNGSRYGAEAVSRGEILYQKKEKGQTFSESERKVSFHPAKGYVTGMIGSIPFLILAVLLAVNTSVQMTEAGTLPSWMSPYLKRSDIGNALIGYTQAEGMNMTDYIRMLIRICIIPFVNLVGTADKTGLCTLERFSPIILLLPAVSYGTGYLTGRNIRTKIHTAISENDKKRIRKEKKRKAARARSEKRHETEKLN